MARVQVDTQNNLQQIRPSAAPVPEFARPEAPTQVLGDSKLTQLAQALSGFSPKLMGYLGNRQERIDQSAIDKAVEMRTKTALNYKEAVKKGIITPDQNPFFVKAWKEQDGRVTADQYNSDLLVSLSTGPFAQSTDHADTDKLLNTFRTNWVQQHGVPQNDPAFMDGFSKKVEAYDANAREHQAAMVGKRIVNQTMNNTYHEIVGVFDDAQSRDLPATSVAEAINTIANRGILVGMDPKEVNSIILDATVSKALETKSITPFQALEQVKTGSGFLSRTREAVHARETISTQIANDQIAADNHAWQKEQRDRQRVETETSSLIFGAILDSELSGSSVSLSSLAPALDGLSKVNPSQAEQWNDVIRKTNDRTEKDIPEALHSLYNLDFEKRTTQKNINDAYASHLITSTTAKDLTDRLHARIREGIMDARYANEQDRVTKPKDISQIPAFQLGEDSIRKAFGQEFGVAMDASKANRMSEALYQYRIAGQAWRDASPNVTTEDILRKSGELRKNVLDLYSDTEFTTNHRVNDSLKDTAGAKTLGTVEQPKTPLSVLTRPQSATQSGASSRLYPNTLDWSLSLDEYMKDPKGSALAKELQKRGITTPQAIGQWLNEQNSLYDQTN